MRSDLLMMAILPLSRLAFAFPVNHLTGSRSTMHNLAQGSSNQPSLIDFFAKEKHSSSSRNAGQSSRPADLGKDIRQPLPDLDLSLQVQSGCKEDIVKSSSPTRSHDQEDISTRDHRYIKHKWQRKLNDARVEEIYRIVGKNWKASPKATIDTAIDRVGEYLKQHPHLVERVRDQDEAAIKVVSQEAGPKRISKRFVALSRQGTMRSELVTVAEVLDNRRLRPGNLIQDGVTDSKNKERAPPKWAPTMNRKDRLKLISRLAEEWNAPPDTIRSRLYNTDARTLQKHAKGLLNDDSTIYKDHARKLFFERQLVNHLSTPPHYLYYLSPYHVQDTLVQQNHQPHQQG